MARAPLKLKRRREHKLNKFPFDKISLPFFPNRDGQKKGWLQDTIETVIIALVLALIIRAWVIQVFWIPSGSMIPTLDIQDRIVVNKFIYRFREPHRQEIIVFKAPAEFERTGKKELIKRILGAPGDTLQLIDGVVFINGRPLKENYSLNRDHADFGPIRVPPGYYFMMGDNRPNSADSRYWGFLPRKNVVGPAFFRIWPLTRFGIIW
ncbi:MAG: signal peptidase I [Candidatus Margulisiibacteriota bacterium]